MLSDMRNVHMANTNLLVDFRALLDEERKKKWDSFTPPLQMLCIYTRYGGVGWLCPNDVVDAVQSGKVSFRPGGY